MAAAPAPALAASSCASYRPGRPLPASAFTATYVVVRNETLGLLVTDKLVAMDFGFRISDEAKVCGVASGSITSSDSSGVSRATLSNGRSYAMTNGGGVPANGTVGSVDRTCRGGLAGTQACATSGVSAYNVRDSQRTSSESVTGVSVYRSVAVSGYGTTAVYLNASFATTELPRSGTALSVTAAPIF